MRMVDYCDDHYVAFVTLLDEYFKEVNKDIYIPDAKKLLDVPMDMLDNGRTIYVLEDDDRTLIGFLVVYMNDQWGMLEQYVECEYMFITETRRSSMAPIHMFTMVGAICEDYQCGAVGCTYNSSANIKNNERVGGIPIATIFSFAYKDIVGTYNKYKKRIMNGKRQ